MTVEKFERGPLVDYEITWTNGHVETIRAHQVMMPGSGHLDMFSSRPPKKQRWTFHGEIDGHWRLILSAPEEDIRTVRDKSSERALLDGER